MSNVDSINNHDVCVLSKSLAEHHIDDLVQIIREIPIVKHGKEHIMAESKGSRVHYGKWEHSLVVLDKRPLAVVLGYERAAEDEILYPYNTIYLSELAVRRVYHKQGMGSGLVRQFLDYNQKMGWKHLDGRLGFSLQTNAATWNRHVQDLYRHFGFKEHARKIYDNRVDLVMSYFP